MLIQYLECLPSKSYNIMLQIIKAFLFVAPIYAIIAVGPIEVSPNTENSPSVYLFPFKLSKNLPNTGYLLVSFPNYQTAVTPTSCKLVNTSITLACTNFLNPLLSGLTVTSSSLTVVNPNINSIMTVLIDSDANLVAQTSYYLQIILSNVIPSTATLSDSFEFYSVSYNGIIYEQNWNFGQVEFLNRQTNILAVSNLSSLAAVLPGTSSILQIDITIGVAVTTTYSRIKLVLDDPFNFKLSSIITVSNDPLYAATNGSSLYIAPTIRSSNILTPNVIITTFNESLIIGRKFILQVTDIQSPFTRSSSFFSVYSLPFNSISPYESSQLSLPIQTTFFPLAVTLGLPQSISMGVDPMQLYLNQQQYVVVRVVTSQDIPAGYSLYINIPSATLIPGTAFANTSTTNTSKVIYNFTTNAVLISGFALIPSGGTITVSCKLTITNAAVQVFASVDLNTQTFPVANPLFYGVTPLYTAVQGASFLTNVIGSGSSIGQTSWNLYSMNTTSSSSISFTVNVNDSSTGSFLDIYMSAYILRAATFSNSASCTLSSLTAPGYAFCSANLQPTYLNIQINSSSSANFFPINTDVVVTITDLTYVAPSSHSNYIYPFYFKFTRSQAVSSITYSWMYTPNVLPQRDQMSANFYMTISNELANGGANYPNILRIHSLSTSQWDYIIQANDTRVISIFHMKGFVSSIGVPNLNSYPCASNIAVSCMYTAGQIDNTLAQRTILDWDRVDIFIQVGTVSQKFHVIVPDIFQSTSTDYFEVMVGKYDKVKRQYVYLYMQNTISKTPSSVLVSSKTQVTATQLQLNGKAGSYAASVQVDIDPVANTYALSTAAAIIVVSSWETYTSLSALASLTNNNSVTTFGTDCNSPLYLAITSSNFMTFIPFIGTTTAFSFFISKLHLPYTYDLPYYSIFLTNTNGDIDSYNEFINRNAGVFYYSVLLSLSISCIDNSLGVLNTACYIGFTNNHEIVKDGKIYVDFSGMTISTNYCFLTYSTDVITNTSIPVTCTSSSNQTSLVVSLPGTSQSNYPNSNRPSYQLVVYGVGITASSISQSITLTLRDNSGSYIIETGTRLLTTTVANPLNIAINQITYQYNNPIVKSSIFVIFTLPRNLYLDETLVIIMGKDLSDSNTIVQKLNIVLFDSSGNKIQTIQSLSSATYKIIFTVTNPSLIVTGTYTLKIYGLQIPSSNINDIFYIIYQRNFDNLYSLANTNDTTAPFPALSSRINSLITMQSILNTEGLEQQLTFNLNHSSTNVDSNTIWYISLPFYYTPTVWNDNSLAYCEISGTMLPCSVDPNAPYQIKLYNSPRIINAGTLYTISVFGVPCPRKRYLNNNATYANQYIFIGVVANSSSSQYIEYSQLYPNQQVVNPSTIGGYGLIKVRNVTSSSQYCFSNAYFQVNMHTSVAIPAGTTLYLTFPKEFDNFHDIDMEAHIIVSNIAVRTGTAPVVNRRVAINMGTGSVPAGSSFIVTFTNLPTPSLAGTTDMNNMAAVVSSADLTVTVAASSVKTNEAPLQTFIANPLYISFNGDTTVTLTAGTYSLPIPITSSDNQQFLSNILVNFTATGFTFINNPTEIFLGATSQTFTIGADMNLMPTYYVYNTIKAQSSLYSYYTTLINNNIRVVNTPISITVPSTISVPKGGCSLPQKVTLNNPPYTDVSITFNYNNSMYSSDIFWVNPETTNNVLNFTSTQTYQWVSFCCASNITQTSVPVTLILGGTNALSYSITNSLLTVNIQTGVANTTPTLILSRINTLKTVAVYNFTTNTNGFLFYSLTLGANVQPMDALSLKVQIKSMNLTLQSQSDFLTHIYTADRDYRVNMLRAVTGNTQITFSNLLPQKSYTLCAYFQNQFTVNTNAVCQTFTTQTWGVTSKAYVKFSRSLNTTEMKSILCFFVREVSAKITHVVDLDGSSCSLGTSPQNYYYSYPGSTFSYELTGTTVYLVSNPEVTTDGSVTTFRNMFDSATNALTTASFSNALSGFSINYMSSGTFQGTFDPISAQNMSSGFTQKAYFDTPVYSNGVITIPKVRLDRIGSVYFILQIQKQIFYNNITGDTNITIRLDNQPTVQQIFNCKDWNEADVIGCARAVLNAGESIDIKFSGTVGNSLYKLYYTSVNEYPLRPVSAGDVQSATITTLVFEFRLYLCWVVLLLLTLI